MKIIDKISGKIQYEKMRKEIDKHYGLCTPETVEFLEQYPEYKEQYLDEVFDYLREKNFMNNDERVMKYFERYPDSIKKGEDILLKSAKVSTALNVFHRSMAVSEETKEGLEEIVLTRGNFQNVLEMAKMENMREEFDKQKMFEERALELFFESKEAYNKFGYSAKRKDIDDQIEILINYLDKNISDRGFVRDALKEVLYENLNPKQISQFYQTHTLPFAPFLSLDDYFKHVIERGDKNKLMDVGRYFQGSIKIAQKEKMVAKFVELNMSDSGEMSKNKKEIYERLMRDALYGSNYKPKPKKQKDGTFAYDEKDNRPTYEELRQKRLQEFERRNNYKGAYKIKNTKNSSNSMDSF